jgi:hypothetical protein
MQLKDWKYDRIFYSVFMSHFYHYSYYQFHLSETSIFQDHKTLCIEFNDKSFERQ